MTSPPIVGVLAIQGGFEAHAKILTALGATVREIRTADQLVGLDGLVLPGGESTVMSLGIERDGLADPLREAIARGIPVLGTCAGMIMLDRSHLGILDVDAERNAFGRQLRSFETALEIPGIEGGPVRAVFIRAPWINACGPDVEVLAEIDGHPVAVRQANVLALAFHPELAGETRIHALLLEQIAQAAGDRSGSH